MIGDNATWQAVTLHDRLLPYMTSDYSTWLAITLHDWRLCNMTGDNAIHDRLLRYMTAIMLHDRRLRYMTCDYSTLLAITQHDWWLRYMIGNYATLMSDLPAWQAKEKVLQDLWTMNNIWLKDSRFKAYSKVWLFVRPNKQFSILHFWRVYFSKAVRSLIPSSAVFSPVCSISHWKKENKRQSVPCKPKYNH